MILPKEAAKNEQSVQKVSVCSQDESFFFW